MLRITSESPGYPVIKALMGLFGLSRAAKQSIALLADALSAVLAVWMAFALRLDTIFLSLPHGSGWTPYILAPLLAIPVFKYSGLYNAVFRYSGFTALASVMKAWVLYAALFLTVILLLPQGIVPRSVGILQPLLLLLFIGGSRAMVRYTLHATMPAVEQVDGTREKVLIYGAGSAGIQICRAMQHNTHYKIAGFLDDEPGLQGNSINGVTIYDPAEVSSLVKKVGVSAILLAIPSISRSRRSEIVDSLQHLGVHIRTLPGIEALADGEVSVSDIREVEIEDLLGRDPVPPIPELFTHCITGKTVMVTGAGGSIGSELCRQIVALRPHTLLLVEQSEYHLYLLNNDLLQIRQEMQITCKVIPVLGDVADRRYMRELCRAYRPDTLYHAAAYKHVPMVERNPAEGLRNNIFGTLSMVLASFESGVSHFVLISTDKAVRPTNIMGASKRICEMVVQAFAAAHKDGKTCFSMVRFGNVLGSSGSVIPLFRKQIQSGGPVTVTHPEVNRYFMTIPEATQLVIQAGAMSCGGDVYLLDMGEPIKIVDLARRMVELSGLSVRDNDNPDGDIHIEVTGLRPGEKLYEELLIGDNPAKTAHPRIFMANERFMAWDKLEEALDELSLAIRNNDLREIKTLLQKIVAEYNPAPERPPGPDTRQTPETPSDTRNEKATETPVAGPLTNLSGNGHAASSKNGKATTRQPAARALLTSSYGPFDTQSQFCATPELSVLIVEDDNATSKLLKHILKGSHVEIHQATNGMEAVELVREHPELSMVLMDLIMPQMDGFEATVRIRQLRPDLPVIIQTAHGDDKNRTKAMEAGCSGFLAKPVAIDQLLEQMQTLLTR
ncbi:MAG: polysaccharide biosynthesis protein [Chlorobi bacterium]|nr:polysaccharide biosynthesis protein [Chlorobiota bacterium]